MVLLHGGVDPQTAVLGRRGEQRHRLHAGALRRVERGQRCAERRPGHAEPVRDHVGASGDEPSRGGQILLKHRELTVGGDRAARFTMPPQIEGQRPNPFRRQARGQRVPVATRSVEHVHENHSGSGARRWLVPRPRNRRPIVGPERHVVAGGSRACHQRQGKSGDSNQRANGRSLRGRSPVASAGNGPRPKRQPVVRDDTPQGTLARHVRGRRTARG